jgi:hypothetical protein
MSTEEIPDRDVGRFLTTSAMKSLTLSDAVRDGLTPGIFAE